MKIALKDIQVAFGNREVLKNINVEFPKKKFVGVIGPNGSGKSTMLKCIYRILQPDGGVVFLDDKNLYDYSVKESAQKQAVLAQHNYYNFDFEVLDVVLMGRTPYKEAMEADNEKDYQIAIDSLKAVGMENFIHSNFSLLSGGEQQRVMLARALTQTTPCLILDEPTNHLDIKYQIQLLNIVKKSSLTVIAAIHDLNIAAMYCDEILAMKNGEIIGYGTPKELLTPEFIYKMYEIKAEILQRDDGRVVVVYENNG